VYRAGHYGVSLLVFAPVGFALTAAGRPVLALVTGGTMVWLATLPDVDHRLPGVDHRGATHTLAFAGLVGAALAAVGWLLAPVAPVARVGVAGYGFALGVLSVGAHLLGDVLTPSGVALLWPLSGRRYSLGVTTADNRVWNYGLLGAGVLAAGAALVAAGGV
jgi:inner membrane protein